MNIKSLRFKIAFTLAEVLIVIGIIGMVADLTLPNLIANFQKQQYVTGLKKAYTEFNQALIMFSNDMGCPGDLKCTGFFDTGSPPSGMSYEDYLVTGEGARWKIKNQALGEEFVKYFKVAKNCGTTTEHCGSEEVNWLLNCSECVASNWLNTADMYRFITASGAAWGISVEGNCSKQWAGWGGDPNLEYCGTAMVDINGMKPPNRYGRDYFSFYITSGKGVKLIPWGAKVIGENFLNGCFDVQSDFCAANIIEDGWQMNY